MSKKMTREEYNRIRGIEIGVVGDQIMTLGDLLDQHVHESLSLSDLARTMGAPDEWSNQFMPRVHEEFYWKKWGQHAQKD